MRAKRIYLTIEWFELKIRKTWEKQMGTLMDWMTNNKITKCINLTNGNASLEVGGCK